MAARPFRRASSGSARQSRCLCGGAAAAHSVLLPVSPVQKEALLAARPPRAVLEQLPLPRRSMSRAWNPRRSLRLLPVPLHESVLRCKSTRVHWAMRVCLPLRVSMLRQSAQQVNRVRFPPHRPNPRRRALLLPLLRMRLGQKMHRRRRRRRSISNRLPSPLPMHPRLSNRVKHSSATVPGSCLNGLQQRSRRRDPLSTYGFQVPQWRQLQCSRLFRLVWLFILQAVPLLSLCPRVLDRCRWRSGASCPHRRALPTRGRCSSCRCKRTRRCSCSLQQRLQLRRRRRKKKRMRVRRVLLLPPWLRRRPRPRSSRHGRTPLVCPTRPRNWFACTSSRTRVRPARSTQVPPATRLASAWSSARSSAPPPSPLLSLRRSERPVP